jgi:HAD superfamily hydrolase (TIGR01490 family)
MNLALFDLDHTLLPIDSADTWSHHVVRVGDLDRAHYAVLIEKFATDYRAGSFDIDAYVAFQMNLLAQFPRVELDRWRADFMRLHVEPALRDEARALIETERARGAEVAIVTGTNSYVTRPIARAFGVDHLLAVRPEESCGRFTGGHVGTHTYREGKVEAVQAWLATVGTSLEQLDDSVFYSDSINDLPLLERVRRPVVTNGDARLRALASARGWPTLQLFESAHA